MLLEDDRRFFPGYLALPLVRAELDDAAKRVLEELAGTMSESEMQALNQSVQEKKSLRDVAAQFLAKQRAADGTTGERLRRRSGGALHRLGVSALVHHDALEVDVPLAAGGHGGCHPAGRRDLSPWGLCRGAVMYVAGVLQTIPSIALLAFLIPVFGIGAKPAVVALFLYALLPILRNTVAASCSPSTPCCARSRSAWA